MLNAGYDIVPVNPNGDEALGLKCVAKLTEVEGPIDVVNVFRRPLACTQVVRDAIAIGAKGVWLQSGIFNEEARQLAADAGIDFVQDRLHHGRADAAGVRYPVAPASRTATR